MEHDFFKDFDVEARDEKDPYYDVDVDFRKRDNDFDSLNSMLFFDWFGWSHCYLNIIFVD